MPQSASCTAQIPCSLQTVAHVCFEMLQALLFKEGMASRKRVLFSKRLFTKGQ